MTIIQTDWSQYLAKDSDLPPDVTFRVFGMDREGDISAHKFLLAGISNIFRNTFFSPMKEEKDVLVVQDTTLEAFTLMINYIYTPLGANK